MLSGVRFNALEKGEILIDKNWTYNNLNGIYAAQEKLKDQFDYANNIGFNIIYDRLIPTRDSNGKLTISNSGYCSADWPIVNTTNSKFDRISIYKDKISKYNFKFICEFEFSERLTEDNFDDYVNYFVSLVKDDNFSWIYYWQISNNPEQIVSLNVNGDTIKVDKIDPILYVKFINKIRLAGKLVNPNINIGGPGSLKGISYLDPDNYLKTDSTFDHNWISKAIDNGLLLNIDFFSLQFEQFVKGLDYNNVKTLSYNIKQLIKEKAGRTLPVYSINQGFRVTDNTTLNLTRQAFYNTSQLLNTIKNGVIPILNCICDPCDNVELNYDYDPIVDPSGYGIFKYDMSATPQYNTLKFCISNLKTYSILTTPDKIYDDDNADDITFISNDKKNEISIVWCKTGEPEKIIIYPNLNEYITTIDKTKEKIINPYEFDSNYNFIIIEQILESFSITDVYDNLFKKFMYYLNYRDDLVKSLPVDYNKEIDDVNFYKILRALALEFADSQVQVDIVKDNTYLETAHEEAIYDNFGKLVNLKKQYNWEYEKYRKLIQGTIRSLLLGPTKNSIENAINLFINYENIYDNKDKIADIKIHELYDKSDKSDNFYNYGIYDGPYPDFAFIVEVNKNIDTDADMDILNRDLKYVVNILKPAHTLSFIIIILSGSEDYKDWYYKTHIDESGNFVEFKNSDKCKVEAELGGKNGIIEGSFGFKTNNVFKTYEFTENELNLKPDFCNNNFNSILNGTLLLGPKYELYNKDHIDMSVKIEETIIPPDLEESSIIRYGYYNDDKDGKIILDNKNLDSNSPDYLNPDSGEYYKNWWMKYHKIVKNNNTNDLSINNNYILSLETDTKNFNRDIKEQDIKNKEVNKFFIDKPKMFTLSGSSCKSILLGNFTSQNILSSEQYEIENSTYKQQANKIDVEKYISPMGTNLISNPQLYTEEQRKQLFTSKELSILDNRLKLSYEVRPYNNGIKVDYNSKIIDCNLPYNENNKRLYLSNQWPWQNKIDNNFYFENMDMTPNCSLSYVENNFVTPKDKVTDIEMDLKIDIDTKAIKEKMDLVTEVKDIVNTKNIKDEETSDCVETINEYKFGYNVNMFQLNLNKLSTNRSNTRAIGIGYHVRANIVEITNEFSERYNMESIDQNNLSSIFKLNDVNNDLNKTNSLISNENAFSCYMEMYKIINNEKVIINRQAML